MLLYEIFNFGMLKQTGRKALAKDWVAHWSIQVKSVETTEFRFRTLMFRIGGQEKREYLETSSELEPAAAFGEEHCPRDATEAISAAAPLFALIWDQNWQFLYFEIIEENLMDLFLRMDASCK